MDTPFWGSWNRFVPISTPGSSETSRFHPFIGLPSGFLEECGGCPCHIHSLHRSNIHPKCLELQDDCLAMFRKVRHLMDLPLTLPQGPFFAYPFPLQAADLERFGLEPSPTWFLSNSIPGPTTDARNSKTRSSRTLGVLVERDVYISGGALFWGQMDTP